MRPIVRPIRTALVLMGLIAGSPGCSHPTQVGDSPPAPCSQVPFRLDQIRKSLLSIPREDWDPVARRFQPRMPSKTDDLVASQSLSVHALRAARERSVFQDALLPDAGAVLRSFLDSDFGKSVYGAAPLLRTRYGLRFLPQSIVSRLNGPATEVHDHQTLVALAELGVSLDATARVDDSSFTVADILRDAIANFYIDKRELAWTAVALSSYLPPKTSWTNKYGETFSFSDLAGSLIESDLREAACGGAHIVQALVVLATVDSEHGVLSRSRRDQLARYLRRLSTTAEERQAPDGSWSLDWHVRDSTADTASDEDTRLLVTGHIGEVLLQFPEPASPSDATLKRAGEWLWPRLRERAATRLADELCPLTHAYCFLRSISEHTGSTGEPVHAVPTDSERKALR